MGIHTLLIRTCHPSWSAGGGGIPPTLQLGLCVHINAHPSTLYGAQISEPYSDVLRKPLHPSRNFYTHLRSLLEGLATRSRRLVILFIIKLQPFFLFGSQQATYSDQPLPRMCGVSWGLGKAFPPSHLANCKTSADTARRLRPVSTMRFRDDLLPISESTTGNLALLPASP